MKKPASDRFGELVGFVAARPAPAVAFSGGVDSSLVALAAFTAHGADALAVTVSTELIAQGEAEHAASVAAGIGIHHETLKLSVLSVKGMPDNPPDRCYHCKRAVFAAISHLARKRGVSLVMDGTNADDAKGYRPGIRALGEMGVISPLAELGFGKDEVRATARKHGLPNWDAPSRPCLATRFPYGDTLEPTRIERVALAEEFMASLGFTVFRIRDHGGMARIELPPDDVKKAVSVKTSKKIVAKLLSLGYNYVTIDLEGFRSGSMDRPAGR